MNEAIRTSEHWTEGSPLCFKRLYEKYEIDKRLLGKKLAIAFRNIKKAYPET
jgi:hypothetical protein